MEGSLRNPPGRIAIEHLPSRWFLAARMTKGLPLSPAPSLLRTLGRDSQRLQHCGYMNRLIITFNPVPRFSSNYEIWYIDPRRKSYTDPVLSPKTGHRDAVTLSQPSGMDKTVDKCLHVHPQILPESSACLFRKSTTIPTTSSNCFSNMDFPTKKMPPTSAKSVELYRREKSVGLPPSPLPAFFHHHPVCPTTSRSARNFFSLVLSVCMPK